MLVPANFNAPGADRRQRKQWRPAQRVLTAAEAAGFKAMALKVAGAFHSPLMQPAADRMAGGIGASAAFAAPAMPVYSNVTARPHGDRRRRSSDLLVEQIVSPVQWERTMQDADCPSTSRRDSSNWLPAARWRDWPSESTAGCRSRAVRDRWSDDRAV